MGTYYAKAPIDSPNPQGVGVLMTLNSLLRSGIGERTAKHVQASGLPLSYILTQSFSYFFF